MSMYFVGIDISKYKHDCCILSAADQNVVSKFTIKNDMSGFEQLISTLHSLSNPENIKIGFESTAHYALNLELFLENANHSRLKRIDGKEPPYMGEDKEYLVRYTKEYLKAHQDIDYFIYGHRHIELDLMLNRKTRLMILGDWIWQFTYAVFDGEQIYMENYIEGESQP